MLRTEVYEEPLNIMSFHSRGPSDIIPANNCLREKL